MRRRTPLLAILLAPVVTVLAVLLWKMALVPLYRSLWFSDTAVQWRLSSDDPQIRSEALRATAQKLRDLHSRAGEEEWIGKIVAIMGTDEAPTVRVDATRSLGAIGHRRSLPKAAQQALMDAVLGERDETLLSAATEAVGQSAARNRYPTDVIQRIAGIFDEQHYPWVYSPAAQALGQIGAAQGLPSPVYAVMNAQFTQPRRPGLREDLARAFVEIAKGRALPTETLDLLADALANEANERIRIHAIYALAYSADAYPPARDLLTGAAQDERRDVCAAAEHGLRLMEVQRLYAHREPIAVALDPSLPVETRLKAMGPLRVNSDDPIWREQIVSLSRDDDARIVVAALGLFPYIDGAPSDAFDRNTLMPRLKAAMSDPEPQVRAAAFGALQMQFVHNYGYRDRADAFRQELAAGAQDPDAKVRIIALVTMLTADPGAAQRKAILQRAASDPDPYVRRTAAGWLGSPRIATDRRATLLAELQRDPDKSVRRAAFTAQQEWDSRHRAWPFQLWSLWRKGEYATLGLRVLTAVTVAAPVVIGGAFLLYYVARLMTYLYQRRWRALAVVAVLGVWLASSYGMFWLYFAAAHAGHLDTGELLQLAGILWLVVGMYGGVGWGMHYLVRR